MLLLQTKCKDSGLPNNDGEDASLYDIINKEVIVAMERLKQESFLDYILLIITEYYCSLESVKLWAEGLKTSDTIF